MENRGRVVCPENTALEEYIWTKWQSMARSPKPLSENTEKTIQKAYLNVCGSKTPIVTLKDFSNVKGVGKWILKLMKGFFDSDDDDAVDTDLLQNGKKSKGSKRYMPQKNSVSYALLITLYRETTDGCEFMRKQELIDAAEASGLSRAPIAPEKGKGKPGQFGSSPREWYSGWSCMKTLISKGLVVKSSRPAKYMLTEEGRKAAQECLMRSNLTDSVPKSDIQPRNHDSVTKSDIQPRNHDSVTKSDIQPRIPDSERIVLLDSEIDSDPLYKEVESPILSARKISRIDLVESPILSARKRSRIGLNTFPREYLDKFTRMGYAEDAVFHAFEEVSKTSPNQEASSLWPAILCCLKQKQVYSYQKKHRPLSTTNTVETSKGVPSDATLLRYEANQTSGATPLMDSSLDRPHPSSVPNSFSCSSKVKRNGMKLPPLNSCEKFEQIYEVILILDNREYFARGSKTGKLIENICKQFNMKIEVRLLPIGDAIWVARHRHLSTEYVLDFIVERKKVDDLRQSITDNRYRDQKLRLLRCGLKKVIYMVEGDPNCLGAADSIKTACFTTEILEGFDVQRTSGLGETLRRYGYMTKKIANYYQVISSEDRFQKREECPSFKGFIRRCENLDKLTVSDVFATQLMQVPQVSEEIAAAVVDLYPTLSSLARAYSLLDGDQPAQEELLKKQTNDAVNSPASRNIFRLVWGN